MLRAIVPTATVAAAAVRAAGRSALFSSTAALSAVTCVALSAFCLRGLFVFLLKPRPFLAGQNLADRI